MVGEGVRDGNLPLADIRLPQESRVAEEHVEGERKGENVCFSSPAPLQCLQHFGREWEWDKGDTRLKEACNLDEKDADRKSTGSTNTCGAGAPEVPKLTHVPRLSAQWAETSLPGGRRGQVMAGAWRPPCELCSYLCSAPLSPRSSLERGQEEDTLERAEPPREELSILD